MLKLNLPEFDYKISKDSRGRILIFDVFRNQSVVLTPEEWVRQNLLHYLVSHRNYKKGLISLEKSVKVNTANKRFDALCYTTDLKPMLLIECKAPQVALSQETIDQILVYNKQIDARYLLISNGLRHIVLQQEHKNKYKPLSEIPIWGEE